jgi:hypothetical protein
MSLAHQLITAQLNRTCKGATVSAAVGSAILQANVLIGSADLMSLQKDSSTCNSTTSGLIDTLTRFNEGQAGPQHCQ